MHSATECIRTQPKASWSPGWAVWILVLHEVMQPVDISFEWPSDPSNWESSVASRYSWLKFATQACYSEPIRASYGASKSVLIQAQTVPPSYHSKSSTSSGLHLQKFCLLVAALINLLLAHQILNYTSDRSSSSYHRRLQKWITFFVASCCPTLAWVQLESFTWVSNTKHSY